MLDRTVPPIPGTQIVQADNLTIRIAASSIDLTQDIATQTSEYLQSQLALQETVTMILATGNSQLEFLEQIVSSNDIDWSRIIFFHLDEYLGISANHPGSFRYYLHHKVEKKVDSPIFHYIQGNALQPLDECLRYENLLQQQSIDLCLLGIGDNGHLAFNEPSVAEFDDSRLVKLVKLETKTRQQQVNGGSFPNLDAVPKYAYTLTLPAICATKKIFCLAGGKHKAGVVDQTLNQKISTDFPATILRQQSQATLFCDRESFSLYEATLSQNESLFQ